MSKKAKIKTTETTASVEDFINSVDNEQKKKDSYVLLELMRKSSGYEPKIWGTSIIGFGNKVFKSPTTGREVDWFKIGFSPRKANLAIYLLLHGLDHSVSLEKLGKHKTSMGCLYVNKLSDIDLKVLEEMIANTLDLLKPNGSFVISNG